MCAHTFNIYQFAILSFNHQAGQNSMDTRSKNFRENKSLFSLCNV